MKTIFSILIMLLAHDILAGQDIDLLLKARGLQAMERLEVLSKKNGNSKGKNLTKKEHCEWQMENFYFAFAHPETSKIVKKSVYKQLGEGITAYIFILNTESGFGFQMNYIYRLKTDAKPFLSEISHIKDGWVVKVIRELPNHLTVTNSKCIYSFNLENPLDITYDAI